MLRGRYGTQDVGLNEVIPTAGTTHLDHVYRKFFLRGRQADQLVGGASGTGERAELLAEHPRDEGELFFSADRTDDIAAAAMELGSPK
ncbi:MAG: hypothetical protein ACJA07_001926 [Rhodococcus sp. (in: high G+C Gram-positive bacteria)]